MDSSMQYMKEFIGYVNLNQKHRTLEAENLLHRSLSLLSDTQNLQIFRPNNLECSQFYISLYEIMKELDLRTSLDLGTACLVVLEKASKNLEAREDLLNQFRFVPLLAKLLGDVSNKDFILRLLEVIQNLTYGIRIIWEEHYLSGLIQKLIEFIYGEESDLGSLALSVLINICYKNVPSIYVLMRLEQMSTFAKKIKPYGILAHKMLIIIDNCVDVPSVGDVHNFIKKSFSDIGDCFQSLNIPYMKHIVDFLTDTRNYVNMELTLKGSGDDFKADIEGLLKVLEVRGANYENYLSREAHRADADDMEALAQCFAEAFTLLEFLLKTDQNLFEFVPRAFDLAILWVNAEQASATALDLMRTLIFIYNENAITFIKQMEMIVPRMLSKIESNSISNEQIIALFKLMIALLRHTKLQTIVLSNFTESYFDKMFSPLINANAESLNYAKFSTEDLTKYLLCLQILIEFANIAPNAWQNKLKLLFDRRQIHYVLARGLSCQCEDLCKIIFEIAKISDFPRDSVAKITSKLCPLIAANYSKQVDYNSSRPIRINEINEKPWVNNNYVRRLDQLISHIFEAKERSELHNVATSELIELFNYKINLCTNTEQNLNKQLEDANQEITNLSHRVNLLAHEMSQYYSMNFKLHLTQERLQEENKYYIQQRESLKESTNELVKRIDEDRKKYQSYLIKFETKKTEIEVLRKELQASKEKEAIQMAELRKCETEKREATNRIDQLKKSIHKLEEAISEKQKLLDNCEKENVKAAKAIEDLRESNRKSDDLIKHLEKQLAAKNEKIRSYEEELSETEEMRKTILSLMESKRPKRAAT